MFKNLKRGTRLIMVGAILLLIPIAAVGVLSANKAANGVIIIDRQGITFASSVDKHIGVPVAERQYIKSALAGTASIGKPDISKVTGELFVPIASPIHSHDGKIVGAAANILTKSSHMAGEAGSEIHGPLTRSPATRLMQSRLEQA